MTDHKQYFSHSASFSLILIVALLISSLAIAENSKYGPIKSSETISIIAQKVRPNPQITIYQMMLGLQQENPDAFHRNNISGLKQGAVLSIPSEQQFFELEPRAAKNNILAQIQHWKRGDLKNSPVKKSTHPEPTQIQQTKTEPKETTSDTPRITIAGIATTSKEITTSIPPIKQASVSADEIIRIQKINSRLEALKQNMSEHIETLHEEVGERNKTIETLLIQIQQYAQKASAPTTTKTSVTVTTPKPHSTSRSSTLSHPSGWQEQLLIPAALISTMLFIILLLLLRGQKLSPPPYTPYKPT
ncbi:MAG: hypothetical protein GY696_00180 [Gammaproteobacteria bacterium]|nr:hypothetical protein [Gammaproteobacteria bacterium]